MQFKFGPSGKLRRTQFRLRCPIEITAAVPTQFRPHSEITISKTENYINLIKALKELDVDVQEIE